MIDAVAAAQLCMNVPNENKIRGIDITYVGRGTQTADVAFAVIICATILLILLILVLLPRSST